MYIICRFSWFFNFYIITNSFVIACNSEFLINNKFQHTLDLQINSLLIRNNNISEIRLNELCDFILIINKKSNNKKVYNIDTEKKIY